MKISTIVGARPQFIKSAVVSRAIAEHNARVSDPQLMIFETIVHTGQHFDDNMSRVFFDELSIPEPDYNLGVIENRHGAMTGKMLSSIEEVLIREQPDLVVVYGDTNSTLAGALAAVKLHIPVAHVEAGLRSFNKQMPEEINRILTDHVSCLLFCPTKTSVENLKREGITKGVHQVGDVMYDAALFYARLSEKKSKILYDHGLTPNGYILATIHRAENTEDPKRLEAIFHGLEQVAGKVPVVLPLHPRTLNSLKKQGLYTKVSESLKLIKPVGYLDMVMLEKKAKLVVTDSGGVQKEAFFHSVPCVTLRDETEWSELVQEGWNILCPPHNVTTVFNTICPILEPIERLKSNDLYGDGASARQIVELLQDSSFKVICHE